jgi:hypothetical protein
MEWISEGVESDKNGKTLNNNKTINNSQHSHKEEKEKKEKREKKEKKEKKQKKEKKRKRHDDSSDDNNNYNNNNNNKQIDNRIKTNVQTDIEKEDKNLDKFSVLIDESTIVIKTDITMDKIEEEVISVVSKSDFFAKLLAVEKLNPTQLGTFHAKGKPSTTTVSLDSLNGSWNCTKCNTVNIKIVRQCSKCGALKRSEFR